MGDGLWGATRLSKGGLPQAKQCELWLSLIASSSQKQMNRAAAAMAVRHARRNRPSANVGQNRMEALRRHEKFWEELERQNKITKVYQYLFYKNLELSCRFQIIRKYDVSKQGKLNKEELANMLQVFMCFTCEEAKEKDDKFCQDLAGGEKPTEEEVVYVLRTADLIDRVSYTVQFFNTSLTRSLQKIDDHIGPEEALINLETAIDIWHRYLNAKPEIARIFEKHDKNNSGQLEFDELKSLLQELNNGKEPDDDEVGASRLHQDARLADRKPSVTGQVWRHHQNRADARNRTVVSPLHPSPRAPAVSPRVLCQASGM
eukprot:768287-Hanusia_phi.AAC.10